MAFLEWKTCTISKIVLWIRSKKTHCHRERTSRKYRMLSEVNVKFPYYLSTLKCTFCMWCIQSWCLIVRSVNHTHQRNVIFLCGCWQALSLWMSYGVSTVETSFDLRCIHFHVQSDRSLAVLHKVCVVPKCHKLLWLSNFKLFFLLRNVTVSLQITFLPV